jgi:hypothetical protein
MTLNAYMQTDSIDSRGGGDAPLAAGATSTVQADVTGSSAGAHVNISGDLTSSLGNSGSATATLNVTPPPGFTKAFNPATMAFGGTSQPIFTSDNTASVLSATDLAFVDYLPAGMRVATPSNASHTCTGGALTAVAGSGVIDFSGAMVGAGAVCTIQADVSVNSASGTIVATTEDLTSSLGNSGMASAALDTGAAAVPLFDHWGKLLLMGLLLALLLRRLRMLPGHPA